LLNPEWFLLLSLIAIFWFKPLIEELDKKLRNHISTLKAHIYQTDSSSMMQKESHIRSSDDTSQYNVRGQVNMVSKNEMKESVPLSSSNNENEEQY